MKNKYANAQMRATYNRVGYVIVNNDRIRFEEIGSPPTQTTECNEILVYPNLKFTMNRI